MTNTRRYRYLISYLTRIRKAVEGLPDTICNCGNLSHQGKQGE